MIWRRKNQLIKSFILMPQKLLNMNKKKNMKKKERKRSR